MKRIFATLVLGFCVAISGCDKSDAQRAADKAAADKVAADQSAAVAQALADKAAADKAAGDKVAADKLAADKIAADQSAAVAKALANKAAADKLAADASASQAAADKLAAQEKAEASSLPPDLVMMKAEMSQTVSQIDIATAKLDVLSASTGDIKQPGKDAIASIDALDTTTQSVKKRANDMRDRGADYFETWEKQLAAMSTPDVAAIAAKRKDELSAKYVEVLTSMQDSRAAFDPFWTDMTTIRDTLKDDVTPDSVKKIAPNIKSAKDEAATLKDRVKATSAKLDQISVIYTKP